MVPTIPKTGPRHGSDDQACDIRFKAWRTRATGPAFPLYVVHCRTHGIHFTIYPPGFTPYGRVPLVSLSPSRTSVDKSRAPPYEGTYFQAACDAAKGKYWPKEQDYEGSTEPRFSTQCRRLARCALLMGLLAPLAPSIAGEVLGGLKGQGLVEARRTFQQEKRSRVKAQLICKNLKLLPETWQTFTSLATLGYYAGLWRPIQYCHEKTGKLVDLVPHSLHALVEGGH